MTQTSVPTVPAVRPPLVFIGGNAGALAAALDDRRSGDVLVLAPDPGAARHVRAFCTTAGMATASRTLVLVGPDYAGASRIAASYPDLGSADVVVDPEFERDRPHEVRQAREALARLTFETRANAGARRSSAGRYLLQTLSNAPRLARETSVAALDGLFAGLPAVIAAAGPSLDRNLADLAAVRDRVILIACDTAARPLMNAGLDPDFIVAADPNRSNAAHLTGLPPSRARLVAEGSLHPSAFAHFHQRTFVFRVANHQPWPWLQSIGIDAALLETWGSVATSALSVADRLGCAPIAFVGADFSFTDGRPYCRGTSFEAQWALWERRGSPEQAIWQLLRDRWSSIVTATDITGESVESAPHLLSFRDWIVERAAARRDRRVVNATGAGLLAGDGIDQATLQATFADADAIDRTLLERVVDAAHTRGRGQMAPLFARIAALADDPDCIADWLAFGAGVVRVPDITAALMSPEYDAWVAGVRAGRQ